MVKHTQKIRQQKPTNCLSVFDHFEGLALKSLKQNLLKNHEFISRIAKKKLEVTRIYRRLHILTHRTLHILTVYTNFIITIYSILSILLQQQFSQA